jgi:hypothetical protein
VRFSPGIVLAPLRTPTLPPATTTNCYVVGTTTLGRRPGSPDKDEQQRLLNCSPSSQSRGPPSRASCDAPPHRPLGGIDALSQAARPARRGIR